MLTLRPYQLEAIEAIDDSEEDCVVKMFCGTGKSLVMFTYVTDRLEQFPYSVFVFPSLALITQFQDDYLKNIPNVLSVSSEPGSTTDQVIIKNFIELHEQKIICVTYQSLQTLMEVSPCPDVMMFDEAHHAVESYVSGTINDIDCKKVFLTATPPDDELGPIVYEYMHHDGVIQGKLNDFNIMIDFSTENTNETIYDSIIRAVMKTKNSRVLTFHQRVNTDENTSVKNFVNQELLLKSFEKIGKEFPGHGYTSVKFLSIDAGTLPNERKKNLTLLDGGKEHEIVILSSCKTIGEGIDTKKANMVVFVDAKNSLVDIIQNIGRIVRKQLRDSTILIPCWVDKTKYDGAEDKDAVIREDLGKQGNFNGIL
ncbi:MAG: DEAD/DEAH box helicase, partial [Terrimicrobiaceae bacterium]